MRIAITTNTLEPGGAEVQRVHLANELADRGHHVTLVYLQRKGPLESRISSRVRVEGRPFFAGLAHVYDAVVTGTTNTESAFGLLSKVRNPRHLRWIVAIHNPVGPLAPRATLLTRLVMTQADSLVGLSQRHASAISRTWGVTVERWVENGINAPWASDVRAARYERMFPYQVGYLGRLSAQHKGLDRLLALLAEPAFSSRRALICGTGPDEAHLKRLAENLGIAARVTWMPHATPQEFFQATHTLVLLSRYEGDPMVLLEAQAANAPVVATRAAGGVDDAGIARFNIPETSSGPEIDGAEFEFLLAQVAGETRTEPRAIGAMAEDYESILSARTSKSLSSRVVGLARVLRHRHRSS